MIGAAQCLCILTVGRLCFEPLVEHSKVTVNVCNQCIAVIQNSGLHTVLPLHGKAEAFREKTYRNISAALFLYGAESTAVVLITLPVLSSVMVSWLPPSEKASVCPFFLAVIAPAL